MQLTEFCELFAYPHAHDGCMLQYNIVTEYYIYHQFNMIARLEDVIYFQYQGLTPTLGFQFALKLKMHWSKNVLKEHDIPGYMLLFC